VYLLGNPDGLISGNIRFFFVFFPSQTPAEVCPRFIARARTHNARTYFGSKTTDRRQFSTAQQNDETTR
jgi:hypothetical protein